MAAMQFSFMWTINNFSSLPGEFPSTLQSPSFTADNARGITWCLRAYTQGLARDVPNYLSVYLMLLPCANGQVLAKYRLSIVNSQKQLANTEQSRIHRFFTWEELGCPKFIDTRVLMEANNCLMPDGHLTIYCEVAAVDDWKHNKKPATPSCLEETFGAILNSGMVCDVTLSADGKEFRAHKAILSARSSVFEAMFLHNMVENQLGRVDIPNIKHSVVMEMLKFIYTGQAPALQTMAEDLLVAADRYDLQLLKLMCEEALASRVSVETAADTLVLAERHSSRHLNNRALRFITTNNVAGLVASGE